MIDADKIIGALRDDPAGALRRIGDQVSEASGALAERLRTDPAARNTALVAGGGVIAGLLAGSAAPRFGGALARLGGVAALGGLAWYAWKRHEEGRAGQPHAEALALPPASFQPAEGAERERLARLMLKAMINAAKADGAIDTEEKARLFDRLGQIDLSAEERDFLFDELARPIDTDGLVGEARSPAVAAQVYAASLLIVDPDRPAERAYLSDLAHRLGVSPELAAEIRAAA